MSGKVLIARSCSALCYPMDCNPLGSSVHGILQARILEWVLPQGIFLTQGLNSALPYFRQVLYRLSHLAKGAIREVSPNHYCWQRLTLLLPVITQKTIMHIGRSSSTNRRNKIRKINIEDKN